HFRFQYGSCRKYVMSADRCLTSFLLKVNHYYNKNKSLRRYSNIDLSNVWQSLFFYICTVCVCVCFCVCVCVCVCVFVCIVEYEECVVILSAFVCGGLYCFFVCVCVCVCVSLSVCVCVCVCIC